jgi:alkylhydroperoxidase family enzyme
LPSLRPVIGKAAATRKVDRLSCVRFGSARYSVPTRLIGQTVAVVETGGKVRIVDTAVGEIVAEHVPVPPGDASVLDEHYGGPRPAPRRAVAFLTASVASGNTRLAADLDELAALRAAHGDDVLITALERAVEFRRWRTEDVRSILAAGVGIPQPRPAGDALVLELPRVPTRPLSAYAINTAIDTAIHTAIQASAQTAGEVS